MQLGTGTRSENTNIIENNGRLIQDIKEIGNLRNIRIRPWFIYNQVRGREKNMIKAKERKAYRLGTYQ